jgi:hypothetical protein
VHRLTLFSLRIVFTENNMTVVHHPLHSPPIPLLNIKLKGSHFDTIETIEAESQAVLNTLTKHDSQDAFKVRQKRLERRIRAEVDYFDGDGGQ